MMQIVYFSHKKQFLAEMNSISGQKLFITPSPAKADNLRTLISSNANQDVITIAKFTSDFLKQLWDDETRPQMKRKAELLLIFGILKNKYFSELSYEQFSQAYNLFSDLRSFTLDQHALASVLDEQTQEVKRAVELFWKLLEITNYVDEHGAYGQITEKLRECGEEESLKKTYIFWGFQHLNGQQIDLLKALSIRYQVIIPFPLALKDQLKRSDWISWIQDHKVAEKELEFTERKPQASWLAINSREIAFYLKNKLNSEATIILGVSKLNAHHLHYIPSSNLNFKIPYQLVQSQLNEISETMKRELPLTNLEGLKQWLENKKKETLKTYAFKKLKGLQLYEDACLFVSETTEENIVVDSFFQKLLAEVTVLNQPRTSYFPLTDSKSNVELKDMSSLEDIDRTKPIYLCIDDRFDDIQGLGQNYPENIQKQLSALGPMKRNDLDLLFKKWELEDLISEASVSVLMSPNVLKHNLIWKRIFNDVELVPEESLNNRGDKQIIDYMTLFEKKAFRGTFSASKYQTFIDCPRKFYYSYVEKLFPDVALKKDINPLLSGTITHEIIEKFYKQNLNENDLAKLTESVLQEKIREYQLQLPREIYDQKKLIFNHRSLNGIQFLKKLAEIADEKIDWEMEKEFSGINQFKINGKIDCFGVTEKHVFLLDFKSSKMSAATNAEVEAMESMQLWIYFLAASQLIPDFHKKIPVMGFVVLDDPEESNLLLMDEELNQKIKEFRFCRSKILEKATDELLSSIIERVEALTKKIEEEKIFSPAPRKSNTCHFCEIAPVCVKGQINV
ncbi:MAG: PD-(D/E)XK nuclease family protein [Bacteriovoracaceae bacterium]